MSDHDDSDSSALGADTAGQPEGPSTCSEAETTSDFPGEDAEPPLVPSIEAQLESARKEAADNFERFVRAKADIENVLKRHQRELSDRARYDGETLARDVLPAIDDLERALEHGGEGGSGVSGGVELVLKGMLAALKRNGVERIDALGKPFDPAEHEAVTMVETADQPPGTVTAVFRSGYTIRDRLLRAAMVSVAKAPDSGTPEPKD